MHTIRMSVVLTTAAVLALAPSSASAEVRTDLSPGDVVKVGNTAVHVPEPGNGIAAFVDGLPGQKGSEVFVLTDRDGTVHVGDINSHLKPKSQSKRPRPRGATTQSGQCLDNAYSYMFAAYNNARWESTIGFYITNVNKPGNINSDAWKDDAVDAVLNIMGVHNSCSFGDINQGASSLLGHSTVLAPDFYVSGDGANTCKAYSNTDGKSVFGWNNMVNAQGIACVWIAWDSSLGKYKIVQGDTALYTGMAWQTTGSSCSNAGYVENVMTHEFGHVIGLAHSEGTVDHPPLTMNGGSGSPLCTTYNMDLGKGDMNGIGGIY